MGLEISSEFEEQIRQQVAAGNFASEEDFLKRAVLSMKKMQQFEENCESIQKGMLEFQKGETLSLKEVDQQLRDRFDFLKQS